MENQNQSKNFQAYCRICSDVGAILIDAEEPYMAPYAYKCSCKRGEWRYSALPRQGETYSYQEPWMRQNQAIIHKPSQKQESTKSNPAIIRNTSFVLD
jgi:hypothetical protein